MHAGQQDFLTRVIDAYLVNCYTRCSPPRFEELAQVLRMHPMMIRRRARRTLGITVSRYMKIKQLRFACALLLHSELPVDEVARIAAFGSRRTFIRAFRREMRQTPGAYRGRQSRASR
jgi:AraC-like DNA-binding protein